MYDKEAIIENMERWERHVAAMIELNGLKETVTHIYTHKHKIKHVCNIILLTIKFNLIS